MTQICCKELALGYEGRIVTSGLNFEVNKGDYLCIVGENGTGKSTLMKAILGLKAPASGSIELGDGLQQREIGYLPQQTPAQKDFPASVQEIVMTGFLGSIGSRPFYLAKEKKLATKNMEKLGILPLAQKCYRDLSGGQKQRVLLARALCATEKMLLLDEPVAGLDPKVTGELYDLIRWLNREEKITILMVSHDMEAAVHDATHVLHLGNRPLFFGRKEDYLREGFRLWDDKVNVEDFQGRATK